MSEFVEPLPTIGALRAFESAARHLSFTEAAAELGRTQGAISHQIRELESRLDAKLFQREARGIVLSEAGRTYLPFAKEALARLRAGSAALRPSANDNVLTVSCSPNFASKWLVPRLGAFSAAHPDIDLRISAMPQHVTFEGDGIDLAVRHGDGNWPTLDVTRLCAETLIPVCSPRLLPAADRIERIEDLADFVLIHDQSRGGWAEWLDTIGSNKESFDLERGPIFNETSLAIDAAVAGQGIALARSALASLDLAAGRLMRPVPDEVLADFAYWIVCPKRNAARLNIERFREWLLAQPHQVS